MPNRFVEDPNYIEYQRLLVLLHEKIQEGLGDSEEADAIRDQMDGPGWRLSSEEQKRVGRLSNELYLLQHSEIFKPVSDQETRARLTEEMDRAGKAGDWETVLDLLRHRPKDLADEETALVRGHAYFRLEEFNAALPFIRFALKSFPENPQVRFEYVASLMKLNQYEEALTNVPTFAPQEAGDLMWLGLWVELLSRIRPQSPELVTELARAAAAGFSTILVTDPPLTREGSDFRSPIYLAYARACFMGNDLKSALAAFYEATRGPLSQDEQELLRAFSGQLFETAEAISIPIEDVRKTLRGDAETTIDWESSISPRIIDQIDERTGERARHLYEGGITSEPVVA